MANPEHLAILHQGVDAWNEWRKRENLQPDLTRADLSAKNLARFNLSGVLLSETNLNRASLTSVDLSGADLSHANLGDADLRAGLLAGVDLRQVNAPRARLDGANLHRANLQGANLSGADFSRALAQKANFTSADLSDANFSEAKLNRANFTTVNFNGAVLRSATLDGCQLTDAYLYNTVWADVDLSETEGLESCRHLGPSSVDTRTLERSGRLPEAFLRGCGLSQTLIDYRFSLFGEAIQYESCFISYSHKDEDFTKRLHERLRSKGLRVWYAPEDVQGGKYLRDQIDQALQLHDRLLLVLSPDSMASDWVRHEVRRGLQREKIEDRRILFPIRLVEMGVIQNANWWDETLGKDLSNEICRYYIPDFRQWKDEDTFTAEADRLTKDLQVEAERTASY